MLECQAPLQHCTVFSAHQTSQRYEMDTKHLGAGAVLKPQGCDDE